MVVSSKINIILGEIEKKKKELKKEYQKLMKKYDFKISGKKIFFSKETIKKHRKFKVSWLKIFSSPNVRHLLSIPFIYIIVVPIAILDIFLFLYQQTAFRLYKIPLVRRKDHLVFDRKELSYLNFLEKFNCLYCSYANGIFSYAVEIAGRTEKYWCPIKHAKKHGALGHSREKYFADYGDAEGFREIYNQTACFRK